MDRADTARVLEVRQMFWPHTPVAADAAMEVDLWHTVLARFDAEVVVAVLRTKRAQAFAPTLGQVEEAIMPTPSYADALAEFQTRLREGYSPLYTAPERVPWSHPLIAAFAADGAWAEWGTSPDSTSDPDAIAAEAAFRAHFRERFKGVAARHAAQVELPALSGRTRAQIERSGQRQIEGT